MLDIVCAGKDVEGTYKVVKHLIDNVGTMYVFRKSGLYKHMKFRDIDEAILDSVKEKLLEGFRNEEELKELTCGDCSRLNEDTGCFACQETDSAMYNGHLCIGFIDKREEEFNSILTFWKVQGLYDREKINKLLDDFEQSYDRLFNQE